MPTAGMGAAFALSVTGLGYFVAVAVQLTKFPIKALPLGADSQNSVVRMYVFLVGIVVVLAVEWLSGATSAVTRAMLLSAITDGLGVAVAAITIWHVLGPNALPTPPAMLQGLSASTPVSDPVPCDPAEPPPA